MRRRGGREERKLTRSVGLAKCFEARGVGGKVPVTWAPTIEPVSSTTAREAENMANEWQLLGERNRKKVPIWDKQRPNLSRSAPAYF